MPPDASSDTPSDPEPPESDRPPPPAAGARRAPAVDPPPSAVPGARGLPEPTLIVVERVADWPLLSRAADLIEARAYLTDPRYQELRRARVFNLCRSYRYQSTGYYVSLLAEARGHRPLPSVTTIQDLKNPTLERHAAEELEETIDRTLAGETAPAVELTVVFGQSLDGRRGSLARSLFRRFPAPFLVARFERDRDGGWDLHSVGAGAAGAIPEPLRPSAVDRILAFLSRSRPTRAARPRAASFDLAILHDPKEAEPPSNARALVQFVRAAESLGLSAELVDREDYGLLPQFDALFIRETTRVHHHTYRFARRAAAEGMVVIDDPVSIARCTNKVYLAELLRRHGVPAPETLVVDREGLDEVARRIGLPCVLKLPDGSFSRGVVRADTREALIDHGRAMLERSDLVVAQRYVPTGFDWRIGVFDRKPLFVCRYLMADAHWQVIKRDAAGVKIHEGGDETLPIDQAPPRVVEAALRAANLIGDGLYGVDLKEVGGRPLVIEVNDNPNIDAGVEDRVLGPALYRTLMEGFLRRIERLRGVERPARAGRRARGGGAARDRAAGAADAGAAALAAGPGAERKP